MQYTRNTTMIKTDRDTLRSLHGRKSGSTSGILQAAHCDHTHRRLYPWLYSYRHVTKKEDVLYLGLVNITAGSDLTEQLTTGFAEAQGLTKNNRSICCPACCSAKANAQRSSMYMLRR